MGRGRGAPGQVAGVGQDRGLGWMTWGAAGGRRGRFAGLGCRHRHPGVGSSGRREVGAEVGHSGLRSSAPASAEHSPGQSAAGAQDMVRALGPGTTGAAGCSRLGDKTGFSRGRWGGRISAGGRCAGWVRSLQRGTRGSLVWADSRTTWRKAKRIRLGFLRGSRSRAASCYLAFRSPPHP